MLRDPVYLDASAIVKLIVEEPETAALREYIAGLDAQVTTSIISGIECARAVARVDDSLSADAHRLMEQLVLLPLTGAITIRAAGIEPSSLRTLDAIHLATAIEIQSSLSGFLGYDNRLNEAARVAGLEVSAPA